MAGNISDLIATLQNGVTAIYKLQQQLAATFPQATLVSTAARGSVGSITFSSSQAVGFLSVTTSSGFAGWVAIYPSS